MLGAGFVAAIAIFFAVWSPAGYGLKKFGITSKIYPEFIGSAFFWLAFSGFVRMCFPKSSGGIEFMIGVILFWIINAAFNVALNRKSMIPIKIAMKVAIIMAIGATVKTVWPDTFNSWDKNLNAMRMAADENRNQRTVVKAANTALAARIIEKNTTLYRLQQKKGQPDTLIVDTISKNSIVKVLFLDTIIEGEVFVKILRQNMDGSFLNHDTCIIQPQKFMQGNYEVLPNAYSPEYVLVRNKIDKRTVCKIGFLTNKPIVITEVPLKAYYSFAGVRKGELYLNNGENTASTLDAAVIGVEYKNETHSTMTLQSSTKKIITLAYRM
jgi:hypothetical protein